jgi:LSM domain-containing protein
LRTLSIIALSPPILHHLFIFFVPLTDAISLGGAQGVLAGYDQKSNVVLSDSKERVYSLDEGVEEVPLGLYLVKGDMMCVATRSFHFSARSPSPMSTHGFRFLYMTRPNVLCHVLIIIILHP